MTSKIGRPATIPLTTLALIFPIALSVYNLLEIAPYITFGPITLGALITVFYCSSAWALWAARPILTRTVLKTVWPLMALILWGLLSLTWYAPTLDGAQNLVVLLTFLGLLLLASGKSHFDYRLQWRAWHVLARVTWIAVGLYGVSLSLGGVGSRILIEPRSFALFALFGAAWSLATWRYDSHRGLWQAIIITLVIGASLSRLALGIALALFPLSQASLGNVSGWLRTILSVVLLVGSSYLAITHIAPLHDRFFEGDTRLQVGGAAINVTGREVLWRITLDSWRESPWVGKGAGSAEQVVKRVSPENEHPHNDYLRVLHDYGVVGLGLWLLTIANLMWATLRAWLTAAHKGSAEARPHLAAFLSLVAFTAGMVTDNVMVYVFVVAPLGVLVGASIGRAKSY
jgi:O-antigen ligase